MEKKKTKDQKKESKDEKIAELTDTLQHLQAEFENFKKRIDKENASFREYASVLIIEKILPILDSFELALKSTTENNEFVKGTKMIYGQLYDMLEKEGMRTIPTKNEPFDPYKHEVLLTEKTQKKEEDDQIVEELQKGFMFKDKIMRYAKVKVKKWEEQDAGKKS